MLQLSMRMSMNFASRATIGCGLLCWSLLPTLMTTSGFFGKSSEASRAAGDCRPRADASREIRVDLPRLRHGHPEQLASFTLGRRLGRINLVPAIRSGIFASTRSFAARWTSAGLGRTRIARVDFLWTMISA